VSAANGFPELRLARLPRRLLEPEDTAERVEGRGEVLLSEARLAEQEPRLARAPVVGILGDELLEHPARRRVELIVERARADAPQAVRVLEGDRERCPHEEERGKRQDHDQQ